MGKANALLIAMYIFLIVPMGVVLLIDNNANIGDNETVTSSGELFYVLLAVCLIFLIIAGVFNIKSAIKLCKNGDYNKLRIEMKTAKLGSIPFFIAEFFILIALAIGSSFMALFFFWTIGLPIVFVLIALISALVVYAIMLTTSAYGIAFIVLLKKQGAINTSNSAIWFLSQFIPVVDVVATIILLSMYKRRAENQTLETAV